MLNVSLDTHLETFHLAVDFSIETGKTLVLLGESGAGKSTVLRLLAGLLTPERGFVSLEGITYFDSEQRIKIPPQERPFGYVFQDYVLFPHLSVFENVAFGLHAQHLPRRIIEQRVGEVLELVYLVGLEKRRPKELSGGQQQRVAIARALALQPRLLLLDEPLSALDVQTRREVRQELRRILSQIGVTTVMVTHQYVEALLFGHHILVLDQGRVIQQGGQRDLLTYPRSSYIAELVGVNFFRGHIMSNEDDTTSVVQFQDSEHVIEMVATLKEPLQGARSSTISEDAYVIVDPRNVTLYQTPPDGSARNILHGEIIQMLHLGANPGSFNEGRVRVSVLFADKVSPLIAEVSEASVLRMNLEEGKNVYASFKASEAFVYV